LAAERGVSISLEATVRDLNVAVGCTLAVLSNFFFFEGVPRDGSEEEGSVGMVRG
jgi:hypothetical protein